MATTDKEHPISPREADKIKAFLDSGASYRQIMIPYLALVALRANGENTIVTARLTFASPSVAFVERSFESPTVRAIARSLPDIEAAEALIESFASGRVSFAGEEFLFPGDSEQEVTVEVEPFHQGAGAQTRLSVLTMRGPAISALMETQRLDWELKAASPPYLSFQELVLEYGLPIPQGFGIFESFQTLPVVIDGQRSRLQNNVATVTLKAERGIRPADVQLGLVAIRTGEPAYRQEIGGDTLAWQERRPVSPRNGRLQCSS